MNTGLWIVQGLLALAFLISGVRKLAQPRDKLTPVMKQFSQKIIYVIGVLELLGAIGIVLPAITGILVWLVPLAAVGLIMTMIGAVLANLRVKEYRGIGVDMVLLFMAAFVVYGRFVVMPL